MILLVTGYVRNEARLAADIAAAAAGTGAAPEIMATWARLLGRLTDPERFPALHAALAAGVFDRTTAPTTSSCSAWSGSSTASRP